MFYLFDKNEKLINVISRREIHNAVQVEKLNSLITLDVGFKNIDYAKITKAEYIGHFDYDNKEVFYMYKIITNITERKSSLNAVHVVFDELKSNGYIREKRPKNLLASQALEIILNGTRWEVGKVYSVSRATSNWYDNTRLEALSDFIEKWNVELKYRIVLENNIVTHRYIDIYDYAGEDNGKRIVYGSNAVTVKAEENKNIYTALIGRGKGEEKVDETGTATGGYGRKINFKNVEWKISKGDPLDKPLGQEYLENKKATALYGFSNGNPRTKIIEFGECEDPKKLLELTYNELLRCSRPQVVLEASVDKIGKCGIGERINIIRRDIGLFYTARVFEIERNLLNDKFTKVTLGDYIPTNAEKNAEKIKNKLQSLEDALNDFKDSAKKENDSLLLKLQEGLEKIYYNEDGYDYELKANNEYNLPAGFYSFNKPINENPTKVIYIGAGKMAIANSKKSDGSWEWKTFGTGDGLVADTVVAGTLRGGSVKWNLEDGTFLIGKNEDDYLLKFDGSTLKFGDSSIKSENLDEPLKEELKGESSFTHIVYADNGDEEGTFFIEPKDHKWIGIAVTDDPIRPILKSDYKWSKYTGEDGKRGPKGEDGRPGKDGSLAQLPESLKNWDSKSTEINGKYVYTPELFVGTDRDSTYNRTGIYMGDGIRTGEGFISGICGLSNGNVVWTMAPTGAGYIGYDSNRRISWNSRGEVNIPKIRSSDIETKAITTDLLYPGNNNRIVLERGYSPGSNNCKSIDANGSAIRLKVDADTYISMRDSGIVEMYSRNVQFFKFDPRESWYYNGQEGEGWLVLHDAHVSMGWLEYSVYSTRSDRRLKENIKYIKNKEKGLNRENIFDFIKSVDLASYKYKKIGGNNLSMIAQDVEEFKFIKDYLVGKNKDGIRLINTGNYTSMMHIALQEEIKKREVLEDKVKSQEARIEKLEKLLLNGGKNHVINGNA